MTETGGGAMTGAVTSRWIVRRTVYLLIGAAVALAFLMLGSVLASPVQGDTITDLRPPAVVALILMAGVGLLPGIREVQVAAAQTLLGVSDVAVPVPMQWRHRWRTALWTFVHQVVGFAIGIAIALGALVISGAVAFVVGQERIDMVTSIERPDTVGAWVLLIGGAVAAVVAVIATIMAGGWGARWAAPLLLGASGEDKLAATERRLLREQEYRRLSQNLHDGVGHALSAISLQAVAGERVVRDEPERAAATLSSIQELAADAVTELDQVLGVMRDGTAPVQPEPTVDDLPQLTARHRDMGMDLDVTVDVPAPIPAPLSRLVYRICAEAVSNAAKHAGPGRVTLEISATRDTIVVLVRNPCGDVPRSDRGGHGLRGLAESVDVFGGTLSTGPDGPTWVLRAAVPTGGARG